PDGKKFTRVARTSFDTTPLRQHGVKSRKSRLIGRTSRQSPINRNIRPNGQWSEYSRLHPGPGRLRLIPHSARTGGEFLAPGWAQRNHDGRTESPPHVGRTRV